MGVTFSIPTSIGGLAADRARDRTAGQATARAPDAGRRRASMRASAWRRSCPACPTTRAAGRSRPRRARRRCDLGLDQRAVPAARHPRAFPRQPRPRLAGFAADVRAPLCGSSLCRQGRRRPGANAGPRARPVLRDPRSARAPDGAAARGRGRRRAGSRCPSGGWRRPAKPPVRRRSARDPPAGSTACRHGPSAPGPPRCCRPGR